MVKPIIFCDFDGVINAIPYENVWVGDNSKMFLGGLDLYDKANWRLDTLTPDTETHFVLDRQEKIVGMRNRPVLLNLSNELISELNKIIGEGNADFMWLTAWREHTQTLLNPLLPFPENTPFLDWYYRGSNDYTESGKFNALRDYLTGNPEHMGRPVVWIDDVATEFHQTHRKSEFDDERKKYSWFTEHDIPHLVIHTDAHWGISRVELSAVNEFIASNR